MRIVLTRRFRRFLMRVWDVVWRVLFATTIGVAFMGLVIGVVYFADLATEHYEIRAIIRDIDDSQIYVVDERGEEWVFEGEGFKEFEFVTLKMKRNFTTDVEDDEIINVSMKGDR